MTSRYTLVLSRDPELNVWTAFCPAMPGAITEGETRDAALQEMSGVMAVSLEIAERDGYTPLPETPGLLADAISHVLADREAFGWDLVIETTMVAPAVPAAA